MNIIICISQTPYSGSSRRRIAEKLSAELKYRGNAVDILSIPFTDASREGFLDSVLAAELVNLRYGADRKIDLLIAIGYPAYYVKHPCKFLWIDSTYRLAYDLYSTKSNPFQTLLHSQDLKDAVRLNDSLAFQESGKLYSGSLQTKRRVKYYTGADSDVLNCPPLYSGKKTEIQYGGFIFCPGHISEINGQFRLVEAMAAAGTDIKAVIAGHGSKEQVSALDKLIQKNQQTEQVKLIVNPDESCYERMYGSCHAVFSAVYDEENTDPVTEACGSKKAVIYELDSNGSSELIQNGRTGFCVSNHSSELVKILQKISDNPDCVRNMGEAGFAELERRDISWKVCADTILAEYERCDRYERT